jgi:hypothetical protein
MDPNLLLVSSKTYKEAVSVLYTFKASFFSLEKDERTSIPLPNAQ